MQQQANRHRSERSFSIGNFVYLKLQPYRHHTLKQHRHHKLLPKFFGPFKILDRIGGTAYHLEIPTTTGIHPVFHVSQLKLCPNPEQAVTVPLTASHLPPPDTLVPEAILGRKMVKRGNIAATKVLVQWKDCGPDQATWEYCHDLLKRFPNLHP